MVWSTPKPVWFPQSPRPCFYSNNPGGYIYNSGGSGIRMEVGWLFPPFLCRRHRVFSRRKGWVGVEEEKIIKRTEFTNHKVPNPGFNQMFVCLPYAFKSWAEPTQIKGKRNSASILSTAASKRYHIIKRTKAIELF